MNTVFHAADSRGYANHGWLESYHTFSFASYFDHERVHFGALRVLNDDAIAGGTGFGTHPHRDMEIVSIPLAGSLRHKDSMGNEHIIKKGEVQVMTAGTGVAHSEMNGSSSEPAKFLQIWVMPRHSDLTPKYEQRFFDEQDRQDRWQTFVSPIEGEGLTIQQDASFRITSLSDGNTLDYHLSNPAHGVYFFVLNGQVQLASHILNTRDGLGVSGVSTITLKALSPVEVLAIEVPMMKL